MEVNNSFDAVTSLYLYTKHALIYPIDERETYRNLRHSVLYNLPFHFLFFLMYYIYSNKLHIQREKRNLIEPMLLIVPAGCTETQERVRRAAK